MAALLHPSEALLEESGHLALVGLGDNGSKEGIERRGIGKAAIQLG